MDTLAIADLFATRTYTHRLHQLGLQHITRTNLGWRMWASGPWHPTHLVTARQPHKPLGSARRPTGPDEETHPDRADQPSQ